MSLSVSELGQYNQGAALASNEFLASLGVKHAVGALGQKRRGAVHEDHTMAPSRDLPEKLREFERRRGVNHMQIFLEQLVAEILEQNGANHSLKKLIRVQELLAGIIAQVQKLSQGSKGRDARALMRLREQFIMLSHADREANLPPAFRAGAIMDGQTPVHLTSKQTNTASRAQGRGSVAVNKSLPDIEMSRASDISTSDALPAKLADATAEISKVTAIAEDEEVTIAARSTEATQAMQEAYKEAIGELKSEKVQNKRLRARLQKMEQSVRAAESKTTATEEKLKESAERQAQMQQKLHSQELLLKAKDREVAELAPTNTLSLSNVSKREDEKGSGSVATDTTGVVPGLRREVEDLKEELGRRAIMLGKMDGQVAKAEAKAKTADTRIRLAEGRLAEAESMLSLVRDDNAQEEASVSSLKKQLASASIKLREQQATIDFILRNLELMELKVAEVTVEAQIAREKRKRAEKKLRLLQETQASNNLPLQAIGESTVESDAATTEAAIEAAEVAEAKLEAKSREVAALLQEKREWDRERNAYRHGSTPSGQPSK